MKKIIIFLLLFVSLFGTCYQTNAFTIDDETNIYIPEGIQTGEKIRIPNKGYYTSNSERGDLIAEVKVVVPKHLSNREKDIYKELSKISSFNPRV